jgi:hypothetical protein
VGFNIPDPERFAQLVAQLLSFPLGCAWARTVPGVRILGVSLNPGPFSLKEHVVITIMATMGSSSAYAVRLLLFGRGDPILPVALVLISDCMGCVRSWDNRPTLSRCKENGTARIGPLRTSGSSSCPRNSSASPWAESSNDSLFPHLL